MSQTFISLLRAGPQNSANLNLVRGAKKFVEPHCRKLLINSWFPWFQPFSCFSECLCISSQCRIQIRRLGGKSNWGAPKCLHLLNTKGCLRQSLCVTQKRLSFVGKKVAVFVGRTMLFFKEWPQFESALCR